MRVLVPQSAKTSIMRTNYHFIPLEICSYFNPETMKLPEISIFTAKALSEKVTVIRKVVKVTGAKGNLPPLATALN